MDPNVVIAAITASGSIAIAITALVLTYRGLNTIEHQIDDVHGRISDLHTRIDDVHARIGDLRADMIRIVDKIDNPYRQGDRDR